MMATGPITQQEKDAVERFKEVCERSTTIDPGEEFDWYALSLGFFLACGLSSDASYRLSSWARYDQAYWQTDPPKSGISSLQWVQFEDREELVYSHGTVPFATVYSNGLWYTWDRRGVGGENDAAGSVKEAKVQAELAVIRQGFIQEDL
jgi:hypothetical protein